MAFTDSTIGYVSVTLVGPSAPARSDSLIGFAGVTLVDPVAASAARSDSLIGFTTVALRVPHRPVLVLTPSGYKRTAFRMFDGSSWR
jgi:hypothetical protein